MKTMGFLLVCLASLAIAGERSLSLLVSTEWLATHSGDENLVILHVGFNRREFALAHIPGARFLWYAGIAPSTPDASTEMPARRDAEKMLGELGVTGESRVVLVFTGTNMTPTARAFLALSYFGLGDRTALLDGGFEAWKGEKRKTESGIPAVQASTLQLSVRPSVITDADWVREHLAEVAVVDARARAFYDGAGGGALRQGHIAGAKNIPFSALADSANRMLPDAELQRIFDDAGIARGATVVSYCHVGQQASLVFFAARLLGYDAKVYDGSFEDWNLRDDRYPVDRK
jgi:thiosulfate/3-mercaptopyruvate sulfurtransferase